MFNARRVVASCEGPQIKTSPEVIAGDAVFPWFMGLAASKRRTTGGVNQSVAPEFELESQMADQEDLIEFQGKLIGRIIAALDEALQWFRNVRGLKAKDTIRLMLEAEARVVAAGAMAVGLGPMDPDEMDLDNILNEMFTDKDFVLTGTQAFDSVEDLFDHLLDTPNKVRLRLTNETGEEKWIRVRREDGDNYRIEIELGFGGKLQVELAAVREMLAVLHLVRRHDLDHIEVLVPAEVAR